MSLAKISEEPVLRSGDHIHYPEANHGLEANHVQDEADETDWHFGD